MTSYISQFLQHFEISYFANLLALKKFKSKLQVIQTWLYNFYMNKFFVRHWWKLGQYISIYLYKKLIISLFAPKNCASDIGEIDNNSTSNSKSASLMIWPICFFRQDKHSFVQKLQKVYCVYGSTINDVTGILIFFDPHQYVEYFWW